jgi:hypothetical protein
LDVPVPNFLKALLAAYVQFVHPMMPTLDLSCCRRILAGDTASISILPLQAIAFASVPFVDLSDIRKAGFTSRRACRKAFYDKTRVSAAILQRLLIAQNFLKIHHSYFMTTMLIATSLPSSRPSS